MHTRTYIPRRPRPYAPPAPRAGEGGPTGRPQRVRAPEGALGGAKGVVLAVAWALGALLGLLAAQGCGGALASGVRDAMLRDLDLPRTVVVDVRRLIDERSWIGDAEGERAALDALAALEHELAVAQRVAETWEESSEWKEAVLPCLAHASSDLVEQLETLGLEVPPTASLLVKTLQAWRRDRCPTS